MKNMIAVKSLALLAVLCMGLCSPAFSQETSAMQSFRLAKELAAYGYEHESVSALLQSANILLDIHSKKIDLDNGTQEYSAGTVPEGHKGFSAEELLAAAKELTGQDKTYKEWIRKTERRLSGSRGATVAVRFGESFVYGNDGDMTHQISFNAKEVAEVYITCSLDSDADLDLYVYDADGEIVAFDESDTKDCTVSFYPEYTGTFTIQVKNHSTCNATYLLVTN
ncbi:MAG: hypothetical protein J6Y13_10060 [Treponema sp.]|nr:hypothetical protein [Treponema sp.]